MQLLISQFPPFCFDFLLLRLNILSMKQSEMPTWCNKVILLVYSQLDMFRVHTPIIRSIRRLSCSIWFSAPSLWMGGGLESRCAGRVCGADVAVRHPELTFFHAPIQNIDRIIVPYISTCMLSGNKLEDKRFWPEPWRACALNWHRRCSKYRYQKRRRHTGYKLNLLQSVASHTRRCSARIPFTWILYATRKHSAVCYCNKTFVYLSIRS